MTREPEWLRMRRWITWGIPDAWDRFAGQWAEIAWAKFLRGDR